MAKHDAESFLETFVLPLVLGGECHVSDPLDFKDAKDFVFQLPHCSFQTESIDDARKKVLRSVLPSPSIMLFDENDLKLSMAVHNFLVLVHPKINLSPEKKESIAGTVKRWIFSESKMDAKTLQGRHGLLHGLLGLHRLDILCTWWTGKMQFLGQKPPPRLLRWSSLRRVNTDVSTQSLFGLLDEGLLALFSLMLTRTPLTLLLSTEEFPLVYHWKHLQPVLQDKQLSRAVMKKYSGVDDSSLKIPHRHGLAFQKLMLSDSDRSYVPAACQFFAMVLMNRLDYLKNTKPENWQFEKQNIATAIERNEDLKLVYGLPWAMKRQKSQVELDWKNIGDNVDHKIQDFYLETLEDVLDLESLEVMSSLLDRTLSEVVTS